MTTWITPRARRVARWHWVRKTVVDVLLISTSLALIVGVAWYGTIWSAV